jgi:hypothetical protein
MNGGNSVDAAIEQVVVFYETLSPATLRDLRRLYAEQAVFKDPFNEVRGVAAIEAVFNHMFATLTAPRFVVSARFAGRDAAREAMLLWEFRFSSRALGGEQCIRGSTHLRFDPAGRVVLHRDYWDAAEEVYARVPGLGLLLRALRRRLAAPHPAGVD